GGGIGEKGEVLRRRDGVADGVGADDDLVRTGGRIGGLHFLGVVEAVHAAGGDGSGIALVEDERQHGAAVGSDDFDVEVVDEGLAVGQLVGGQADYFRIGPSEDDAQLRQPAGNRER